MATVKTPATLDKRETLTMLENFFQEFKKCCTQQGPISASVIEPFLTKNFQLTSNEHVVARSLTDYLNRLSKFQKKFSNLEVTGPSTEPLISGNKIAVQYTIDYTARNGQKGEVAIMAIGTFEDHKIASWTQVTHEKGATQQWDA